VARFALIHGGGGSAWDWHLVVPELDERGHESIAVDLPTEDGSAGWWAYADAVVDAVRGRQPVIVVGHSLARFTAPIVCLRISVDLLVLVAAMIPSAGERLDEWWTNAGYEDTGFDDVFYTTLRTSSQPKSSGENETTGPRRCARHGRSTRGRSSLPGTCRAATIACSRPAGRSATLASASVSRADEIDGGHYVALSRPRELAQRLDAHAASVRKRTAVVVGRATAYAPRRRGHRCPRNGARRCRLLDHSGAC
jgi:pimeloyl-ACP methyl ester carboxylesterase